jgi:hypothetical protein
MGSRPRTVLVVTATALTVLSGFTAATRADAAGTVPAGDVQAMHIGTAAALGAAAAALAVMGHPLGAQFTTRNSTRTPAATPLAAGPAWHSGASGEEARDGSFASWRGRPLQVIAVWGDTSAEEQARISMLDEYASFSGDVDVAVGALVQGETWTQAARGAFMDRWTRTVRTIKAKRAHATGTTYIRPAHEMNGDWMPWSVNAANVTAFKQAWRLYVGIIEREFPAARVVFSPNNGTHSDIGIPQMWPGDDVVDVIGIDFYDGWPAFNDRATWNREYGVVEKGDSPKGLGAWVTFAKRHGKPLAFPEWGLQTGDRPFFIRAMHAFFLAHAADPAKPGIAGRVLYDIYFNIPHDGNTAFKIFAGSNPASATTYRSLTWGIR